ncbi:hypothetical protein BG58_15950 [Caballeronia jiangsuensis]|nr:hypothetical protein BG58_15950 [Caballeronia jiangsuensis]
MGNALASTSGSDGHTPESLRTLAAYLEISLEEGKCVVVMRRGTDLCSVLVGDPADEDGKLTDHGTISAGVVDELLKRTHVGLNRITVDDQTYRFFRSFTLISDVGAVVFSPA